MKHIGMRSDLLYCFDDRAEANRATRDNIMIKPETAILVTYV